MITRWAIGLQMAEISALVWINSGTVDFPESGSKGTVPKTMLYF